MVSALDELKASLPGRTQQIEQLYNLFCNKEEPFPASLFISGVSNTGKSIVVKSVLEKLDLKYVIVHLIECYSPNVIYEEILEGLYDFEGNCDNMVDFFEQLQTHRKEITKSVIVFNGTEEFLKMDSNLLPAFLRLQELAEVPMSVIFMSNIILQKYYPKFNIIQTITIHFPQYKKHEILEILTLDFDYMSELLEENDLEGVFDFNMDFYKNYLHLVLSVLYKNCRYVTELRHVARKHFIQYCQPCIENKIRSDDSVALWRHFAPIIKEAPSNLFFHNSHDKPCNKERPIPLPLDCKYLLIAAYLASYNQEKYDKRLFMKYHGKKRKTMKDVNMKSKVSEKLRTQLGPQPFSLNRLFAIVLSIIEPGYRPNSTFLLVNTTTLVDLGLLSKTSSWTLDEPEYICNMNLEDIQGISKSIEFNIKKYLSDFSHL